MRLKHSGRFTYFKGALASIALYFLLFPSTVFSGNFRVTPIRLDLDKDARTGVVNILTEGADKLNLQVNASEWTQDAEGKDVYTETKDLIFFPKIMTLEKDEEKAVRAGTKMPAAAREKAYRLFIEEIPAPAKAEGVNVRIALRFGIPVFVRPLKEEPSAIIDRIDMSNGVAGVAIKNTGNVHIEISSVTFKGKDAKGKEVFTQSVGGWYLLSGVSRRYTVTIPTDVCTGITRLNIEISTDRLNLEGNLDAGKTMCRP